MVEVRIHGRGGQGGVTLAKLLATARFLQGDSVQAFGLYAAERTGAPVQAFCRWSPDPVTNRNLIYRPDHVVVLDPTLIGPDLVSGLKPGGWIVLNTPRRPGAFRTRFEGHPVATVDATAIARAHGVGTRSVPIVNTALAGAVGRVLGFEAEEVEAALMHLGFGEQDRSAARRARADVVFSAADAGTGAFRDRPPDGDPVAGGRPSYARPPVPGIPDGAGGAPPAVHTGAWATEQPRRQRWIPPCNDVCPAGNDVQAFLRALAEDRVDDALAVLLETSPLPAVCGRVCPAPCMDACNRGVLEGAVNVRQLERFAGDHGRVRVAPTDARREKVAVVGSGPAGLSGAFHLARKGYAVVVYEAAELPGGLLRSGIPEFRLPAAVLERELGRIEALGVSFVTDARVDRARLERLTREYDAVLLATGLQRARGLSAVGADTRGVEQGITFLQRVREGRVRTGGETVVVVGGGNTAMDAARSAVRLGAAEVRVVYRRTRAEMPAIREEVEEALEEGVILEVLAQPVHVTALARSNGGGPRLGIVCRRMELGAADASGRPSPVEVPGSDFDLTCDRVILALGQAPDLGLLPETGPGRDLDEARALPGFRGAPVLAVGDLATNAGTVAAAIASGRRAARRVHGMLSGVPPRVPSAPARGDGCIDVVRDEVIRADDLRLHLFDVRPGRGGSELSLSRRRTGFDEVHAGLPDPSEARRCLSCGVCNDCDLCVTYCPEGLIVRHAGELAVDYTSCKGCGVCVHECPRNVIFMSPRDGVVEVGGEGSRAP